MKIRILDFGYKKPPLRAHANDAGADVHATASFVIKPHGTVRIPLGFGLEMPDGYAGFVGPRSSLSSKGITCEMAPVDSGYKGEIHAIVTNNTDEMQFILDGDRVGQLIIMPIVIADFYTEDIQERGSGSFGSTGR